MAFATFTAHLTADPVSGPNSPVRGSVSKVPSPRARIAAEMAGTSCASSKTSRHPHSLSVTLSQATLSERERKLLRRLRNGDSQAFADLVSRLQPGLVRRARSLVLDDSMTDDLVQETWLAVIRGIAAFEGRSALKTWILSIMHNRAKTMLQKEKRTISLTDDIIGIFEHRHAVTGFSKRSWSAEILVGFVSKAAENQESSVLSKEKYAEIRDAIMFLPKRQRMVLELRAFRGMSAQAVSARLGLSEGNQRVLLHRARLNVKRALQVSHSCELIARENSRTLRSAENREPGLRTAIIHLDRPRRNRSLHPMCIQQTAAVFRSGAKN
jgi:RNA polymerase sigma-70 factor, ECF subfamily